MPKMKGLFKGIKFISQIFVYKEHEIEIGNPTNVRHVAHIGWDSGTSVNSPSWMNQFKTASDFSSTSLKNLGQPKDNSWASHDFGQPKGTQPPTVVFMDPPCPDIQKVPKKVKPKKTKSSSHSSSSRSSTKPSKGHATAIQRA